MTQPDPVAGTAIPPTMTIPELAGRVGIDPSTAWRYLKAGKLPGVQVGNRWVIDRGRVERFLAGQEDAGGTPLHQPAPPAPELVALPQVPQDGTQTGLAWLRGLHAALDLLVGSIDHARAIGSERETA